ncbi:MAG: FAD-dependent oxidoreductase [Anaerolineae bacterium]|nr:FAD-dependent oxidoreductase [Anaerolineae bacterium]
MQNIFEPVDVLIVGGGTAGVIAAIQSARAGVLTAIVEMQGQLGGTITTGGVNAPAYFWGRDRQIIAGIGWELVCKAKALDNSPFPDFNIPNTRRPSYHVSVNPALYALVAEEACLEAGVILHYHEILTGLHETAQGWEITTVGKGIKRTIQAREVIDCTGDADAVEMAGYLRQKGDIRQPGTLTFRFGGYHMADLDMEIVQERYEQAIQDGSLQPGDFWLGNQQPFIGFLRNGGQNQQHIFQADSSTSDTQTQANIEGRKAVMRLLRFISTIPGCEEVQLQLMCTQAAIRETYRIIGEQTITYEDYVSGRYFEDALCYTLYFIDVHTEQGVNHEFVPGNLVPTIPFGALIPRGSQRLLVAGRCVSSDRLANSALRIEASCMAMGQAAGAAAALGVKQGTPSRQVPIQDIRALLRKHQAIIPVETYKS